MITDTLNHRIVLFGGTNDRLSGGWFNDLWEIQLDTMTGYYWRVINAHGTAPSGRCDHAAVYDPLHQRMIIFGGSISSGYLNDIQVLSLAAGDESWQNVNPTGPPPPVRSCAFAIYHPGRNSFVLFGGAGVYVWYNDVWELKLDSMVWHEIAVLGTKPAPRYYGGCFLDQANNRMVVFGGGGPGTSYNDLWALDLDPGSEQWTELHAGGSPPAPRHCFAHAYDAQNNKLFVFAGWDATSGQWYNNLYSLDVTALTWNQVYPSGEIPIERRNTCGAYDPFNRDFIVFGGDLGADYYLGGTDYIQVGASGISEWQQPAIEVMPSLSISSEHAGPVIIRYAVPRPGHIDIRIIDATGRIVRNLFAGGAASPSGHLTWDRRDEQGQTVVSGSYYCLLQMDQTGITRKVVILD
jgi:hypothetical protein